MDRQTASALIALNNRFYQEVGDSFSRTREAPWDGWKQVVRILADHQPREGAFSLLDAACGNLRFERFVCQSCPDISWDFTAVDSCVAFGETSQVALEGCDCSLRFIEEDVLQLMTQGAPLACDGAFDAAVSFGFMHHIPTEKLRLGFLRALLAALHPGGVAALSFWRFADEPALLAKAQRVTEAHRGNLDLEPSDYLLGWQGSDEVLRYCHSFTGDELERCLQELEGRIRLLSRFRSDGKSGRLNEYLVFQKL